jgi:class 3 adenylate cyclase
MTAGQTSPRSLKSIGGAIFLALGLLLLFANLDAVAAQISGAAGISAAHEPDALPALVLGTLHAVQSYVFDHAGFFSALLQILVSFWPLILIILGGVLLRDAFRGLFADYKAAAGASAMGDR